MLCDFHTHSLLSDGDLLPIELIRRAYVRGYDAIAVSDHASRSSLERVLEENIKECELARSHWKIIAIPAVELTHVPPDAIAESARMARKLGAWLVLVHGETIVEPVEKGTNLAAIECDDVDILAHPGILSLKEARLASARGMFLELSARKGHCLGNGLTALLSRQTGAKLLLNSDAHTSDDLLSTRLAQQIALGAGLTKKDFEDIFDLNPRLLLDKALKRHPPV